MRWSVAAVVLVGCHHATPAPAPIANRTADGGGTTPTTTPGGHPGYLVPGPPGQVIIRGHVHDTMGSVLAGVTVVASCGAGGGEQVVITDDDGAYELRELEAGACTVTFYYAELTVQRPRELLQVGKVRVIDQDLDSSVPTGEIIKIIND